LYDGTNVKSGKIAYDSNSSSNQASEISSDNTSQMSASNESESDSSCGQLNSKQAVIKEIFDKMKAKTTVGYDLKQENMKLVSILKSNQKYAPKETTFSYDPDASKHKAGSSLAQKCSVLSEWKP